MADRNNDRGQKTLLFWKQSNLYEMVDHLWVWPQSITL